MSNHITSGSMQTIAWMCLCSRCGDRGQINVGTFSTGETCPRCNGACREPIPWSELFRVGRRWIPDWFSEQDEEEFE